MIDNTIGKKLRDFREKCGYTQQHIANALNIDRSTYAYYESGKTTPDISTLMILANIFSVTIESLLGQESETPAVFDSQNNQYNSNNKACNNDSHIYDLSKEEKQLICYYRSCTPKIKKVMLDSITSIKRMTIEKNNITQGKE